MNTYNDRLILYEVNSILSLNQSITLYPPWVGNVLVEINGHRVVNMIKNLGKGDERIFRCQICGTWNAFPHNANSDEECKAHIAEYFGHPGRNPVRALTCEEMLVHITHAELQILRA